MSRLNFNLERKSFLQWTVVFLTELEHAQVTSIEVAYVTNCDPLSSKVRII